MNQQNRSPLDITFVFERIALRFLSSSVLLGVVIAPCWGLFHFSRALASDDGVFQTLVFAAGESKPQGYGRIERIDKNSVWVEDVSTGTTVAFQISKGTTLLLDEFASTRSLPDVDALFLYPVVSRDAVMFRNKDITSCEFIGMTRRFVYLVVYERVVAIPRGRVVGVRFGCQHETMSTNGKYIVIRNEQARLAHCCEVLSSNQTGGHW